MTKYGFNEVTYRRTKTPELEKFDLGNILKAHFHILMVGKTGSGKSYLLMNTILPFLLSRQDFFVVFYLTDELATDDTQQTERLVGAYSPESKFIARQFNADGFQAIMNFYKTVLEEAQRQDMNMKQTLMIFNDLGNQDISIMDYYITLIRHYNINTIFLTQYYTMTHRIMRMNMSFLITKAPSSNEDVNIMLREVLTTYNYYQLKRLLLQYTQNYGTLVFNRNDNQIYYL